MSTCAPDAPTHIGDARVVLSEQEQTRYDILVIDAYSSDAVPVHLTTNEAIALYRDRLKDNGILVLHISNRYYDLSLPLGRSAADLGLVARMQTHRGDPQNAVNSPSVVVMMAREAADFSAIDASGKWEPLQSDGGRVWTDDYANLLSALK
jgi:spermidine synthase